MTTSSIYAMVLIAPDGSEVIRKRLRIYSDDQKANEMQASVKGIELARDAMQNAGFEIKSSYK